MSQEKEIKEKWSEQVKKKMGETRKKLWQNFEYKIKMKKAQKGKTGKYKRTPEMKTGKHMLNRRLPKKWRENMSKERKQRWSNPEYGKKMSIAAKRKMTPEYRKHLSEMLKGEKSHLWRGGKSKTYLYKHIIDVNYKLWRSKVFERDNWTCQTCGKRSKTGEPVYLEAHHIKNWTKNPEIRYEIDNGITVCRECHQLTKNGRPKTNRG